MANAYYLGRTPEESLGDSPRYWYALRKNQDGEMFLVRSDQILDNDSYQLNIPGPPAEDFDNFIAGVDYVDGLTEDHEQVKDNMYYPQYRWDSRSLFYYIDEEGMFTVRINRGYSYPTGISS